MLRSQLPHMNLCLLAMLYDEDHPRIIWKLAKVESLLKGSDGAVRGARGRVRSGNGFTVLNRPVQHLYSLEVNVGDAVASDDVHMGLSQPNAQDKKTVTEPKKVRPARISAQKARQKIAEWMSSS